MELKIKFKIKFKTEFKIKLEIRIKINNYFLAKNGKNWFFIARDRPKTRFLRSFWTI